MRNSDSTSTIIIVNKETHKTEIRTISHKSQAKLSDVNGYKKKLYLLLGIFGVVFMGVMAVLGYKIKQYSDLDEEFTVIEEKLGDDKVKQLQKEMEISSDKLKDITNFLKKREVYKLSSKRRDNQGVGGEYYEIDDKEVNKVYDYSDKVNTVLESLKDIPLGLPAKGRMSSDFGFRGNPMSGVGAENHPGLDIANKLGTPLCVTADGVVTYASVRGGYGKCVMVKHANGYETLYGHMNEINVKVGQKLNSGDIIGKLGSTGRSTGPHVHYEIIRNGKKIDPKDYMMTDSRRKVKVE